jgi:hypothetical protein
VLFLYVSTLELTENGMAQVELGYYANIDAANRVRLFLKNSDGEWIVERNESIWISRQQDERRPSASGNCLVEVELPPVFASTSALAIGVALAHPVSRPALTDRSSTSNGVL